MPFTRIDGVLFHYRLHGPQGAPVLALVNSLGTDARIWDRVIDRLAGPYRVLSYDKRGHGLSDAPPGDYAIDHHIADLAGLLDHLGIDKFALAGVSVGGLIAQGFALRHPARLTALVLSGTAPRIGDAAFWAARMSAIRENGLGAIADGVMERWFSAVYRRDQATDLAGWRNMFLRSPLEGYLSTCATLRDTDLSAAISGIRVPTLAIVGDEDGATPVPLVEACAASIPGARFEIITGAGHIPSIEKPAELAALMAHHFREAGHG